MIINIDVTFSLHFKIKFQFLFRKIRYNAINVLHIVIQILLKKQ